jgi:nitrogen-specific signal transduction histidine kinase
VAQDLISRHGGVVKLVPAERTTFSVYLPAAEDGEAT